MRILLAACLLMVLVLRAAAARVAPPADNHSVIKRGLAVTLLGLAALPLNPDFRQAFVAMLAVALAFVCLDTTAEPISVAPSAYRPYARWPGPLRALSLFTYPGWPSGVVFTTFIGAGVAGLLISVGRLDGTVWPVLTLAFMVTVLLPIAFWRIPNKGPPALLWAFGVHLVVNLGVVALGEALAILGVASRRTILVCGPLPLTGLVFDNSLDAAELGLGSVAMAGWLALTALLLLWRGRQDYRLLIATEARARREPSRPA